MSRNARTSSLLQDSDDQFSIQSKVYSIEKDNFEDFLPKLREALEDERRSIQLPAVQAMLGQCLSLCSPSLLGETILEDTIPVARKIFIELIDEINGMVLTDDALNLLDEVSLRLDMCISLLDSWRQCLEHVESLLTVSASQLKALPESVAEIIKRSFEHCKASKDTYGILSDGLKNHLVRFFGKINDVQKSFWTVLGKVIVFNPGVALEMQMLANIVSTIGETGFLMDGLNKKTLVEIWKAFADLATMKDDDLKRSSPSSVTSNVKSLAIVVKTQLHSAVKDGDERSAKQTLICGGYLLKILDKLCATFSSCSSSEAAFAIVQLFIQLHRFSPPCSKGLDINPSLIDFIGVHLTNGTKPFLSNVINNPEFKLAVCGYQEQAYEQGTDEAVGYQLLILNLMEKLIPMPYFNRRSWLESPHDILDVAFTNINFCQEELVVGKVRVAGHQELGDQPRLANLYEATLVLICGLLIQVPISDFPAVEMLLQKHLLRGQFWSALLASDVWTFIARFGSSKLCYDQLIYLMKVYELLVPERQKSPGIVVLSNLITRLYTLLSNEMQDRLVEQLGPEKIFVLVPATRHFSPSTQSILSKAVSEDSIDISVVRRSLANLDSNPTAENWSRLVKQLWEMGTIERNQSEEGIAVLAGIWNRLAMTIDQFEGIQADVLTDLTMALLHCTRTSKVCDESFSKVLSSMTTILPYAAVCVRVEMTHYLKECVHSFTDSGPGLVAVLAECYCWLFKDVVPWVRQEAYESFYHVAHVSRNERLPKAIVEAVEGVPRIYDTLIGYISQTPNGELKGFPSVEEYLRRLVRESGPSLAAHKCSENRDNQDKRPKLEEQINTPSAMLKNIELDERVEKFCTEIDYLLKRKNDLSALSLSKLNSAVDKWKCFQTLE